MVSNPDNTLTQGYAWERAVFTVPADVTEERVQFSAYKYRNKFGDYLEGIGFEVLSMTEPEVDKQTGVEPDRRRYTIWAQVKRRPVVQDIWVPDSRAAEFQKMGLKPKEQYGKLY